MGKKMKKGKAGNAAQYMTRNQAIKKLQLRLSEFRRLCILKGIHPREPKKKVHGANKTYYHTKDINFLLHEPLLNTFRNIKVYEKKVRKAKAKLNNKLAQRLLENKPGYKLDHLVRERYPSFIDALRDLDDPLTMVHLFATLPAEKRCGIPVALVEKSRRLAMEWQAYVVRTNSLRKVFVSVKGYYYQAEIMGQLVTWLVPHQLSQVLPQDVDFKVMLTFLEFYQTLLQFTLYKLFHALGLKYPPVLDPKLEQAAAGLEALMKELAGAQQAAEEKEGGASEAMQQEVTAEVEERIRSLKDKIQEIGGEEQQGGTGGDAGQQGQGGADGAAAEDDDEPPVLFVDTGSDDDSDDDDDTGAADTRSDKAAAASSGAITGDLWGDADEQEGGGGLEASTSGRGDAEGGPSAVRLAGGALRVDPSDEGGVCESLFKGLTFFLAREVPREPLLFVIRAFGGRVGWEGEGSPISESDEEVTHQVVDRPTQGHVYLSREYVQPQWVFDSANFRVLLPGEGYRPGVHPPPHLSPFVNNEEEGYEPDYYKAVKELQEAANAARQRAGGLLREGTFVGEEEEQGAGALEAARKVEDAEAQEAAYQAELSKELRTYEKQRREADGKDAESSGEEEGGEGEEEEDVEAAAQEKVARKRSAAEAKVREEEEAMKDVMMSRKNRKLYERIKRAQQGKRERVEVLEDRKKQLGAAGDGKGEKGGKRRRA